MIHGQLWDIWENVVNTHILNLEKSNWRYFFYRNWRNKNVNKPFYKLE